MTANAGCAAYAKALAQMAITPMPATKRSERAASTNAPPGIWPINETRAAAESTNPMSICVHFCVVR
jgi:hypothetical protein